jgi:hypothetical protein
VPKEVVEVATMVAMITAQEEIMVEITEDNIEAEEAASKTGIKTTTINNIRREKTLNKLNNENELLVY